jgi:ABC-type nickel/cobalt efflux system permease component RcnA
MHCFYATGEGLRCEPSLVWPIADSTRSLCLCVCVCVCVCVLHKCSQLNQATLSFIEQLPLSNFVSCVYLTCIWFRRHSVGGGWDGDDVRQARGQGAHTHTHTHTHIHTHTHTHTHKHTHTHTHTHTHRECATSQRFTGLSKTRFNTIVTPLWHHCNTIVTPS